MANVLSPGLGFRQSECQLARLVWFVNTLKISLKSSAHTVYLFKKIFLHSSNF